MVVYILTEVLICFIAEVSVCSVEPSFVPTSGYRNGLVSYCANCSLYFVVLTGEANLIVAFWYRLMFLVGRRASILTFKVAYLSIVLTLNLRVVLLYSA